MTAVSEPRVKRTIEVAGLIGKKCNIIYWGDQPLFEQNARSCVVGGRINNALKLVVMRKLENYRNEDVSRSKAPTVIENQVSSIQNFIVSLA